MNGTRINDDARFPEIFGSRKCVSKLNCMLCFENLIYALFFACEKSEIYLCVTGHKEFISGSI